MGERAAVVVIMAMTTGLMLLALAGHNPLTGEQVVTVSGTHGINTGDIVPLAAWVVVAGCCVLLWRRTD